VCLFFVFVLIYHDDFHVHCIGLMKWNEMKCMYVCMYEPHDITSQKTIILIFTFVKTQNSKCWSLISKQVYIPFCQPHISCYWEYTYKHESTLCAIYCQYWQWHWIVNQKKSYFQALCNSVMFLNICGYVYWIFCDRNCPHLNVSYAEF
jgi:hypothetical protein